MESVQLDYKVQHAIVNGTSIWGYYHNVGDNNRWFCLHREDGPAEISDVYGAEFCLHDVSYELDEYLALVPLSDEEKIELKLRYG